MASNKGNGEATELDIEHELPSAESEEAAPQASETGASALEAELEAVRAERAGYLDRLARLQAEFDNFRKRSVKEQQEFRDYALAEALKSLLPILDSLDRALKTSEASVQDFRSGIELIDKQFHDALARLGVEPVPAEGEVFDPNLHQAVQMVDTHEVEDNHVIDELQRGYRIKDRLLRPAMVRVAHNAKK
ncbi:MAG TPA: nucleotide exchange factor GrpE [Candidatus Eisenbacteria bacterium]|nr:nucleotide exchange factor GrpE [Candidatus Eisenbacteria bacterium]